MRCLPLSMFDRFCQKRLPQNDGLHPAAWRQPLPEGDCGGGGCGVGLLPASGALYFLVSPRGPAGPDGSHPVSDAVWRSHVVSDTWLGIILQLQVGRSFFFSPSFLHFWWIESAVVQFNMFLPLASPSGTVLFFRLKFSLFWFTLCCSVYEWPSLLALFPAMLQWFLIRQVNSCDILLCYSIFCWPSLLFLHCKFCFVTVFFIGQVYSCEIQLCYSVFFWPSILFLLCKFCSVTVFPIGQVCSCVIQLCHSVFSRPSLLTSLNLAVLQCQHSSRPRPAVSSAGQIHSCRWLLQNGTEDCGQYQLIALWEGLVWRTAKCRALWFIAVRWGNLGLFFFLWEEHKSVLCVAKW